MVVWGSILVRAWDANAPAGQTCDGQPVPVGFEGMHVFDISDKQNPELVASIDLACGTHTLTAVPDLSNRRLLVYGTPSSAACEGLDIVEVPLSRPEESENLRFEFADRAAGRENNFACHDTGVILGRANKVACAGGVGFAVWSIGGKDGGSRDNPRFLYNFAVPEIRDANPPNADNPTGHSAAFSYDGETIIFGHEPGGGLQSRCKATGEPVTNGANGAGRPDGRHEVVLLLRDRLGQARGQVDAHAAADRDRELHAAQLRHRAHQARRHPGARLLPVGHRRAGLQQPRQRA